MGVSVQFRRDTASNWTSNDPTLLAGEMGWESDTGKFKVGDGSTAWTSLGYATLGCIDTSGTPADNDFAKFTDADTVEGRSYAETLDDLSGEATAAFDINGQDLANGGVIFLTEQADAEADVAGKGQIWVNTATPNELYFTDDAGTDTQLGTGSAHAILDGSVHNDSVADAVTRGSIIYANATPKWDELVVGTNGQVLTTDGTDISWGAAGTGDVTGPASSTDNEIARHDSTTGKVLQTYTSNPPTISDTGDITVDGDLSADNTVVGTYKVFDAGGETITGDGTDMTIASGGAINLTATTDVVVPANVGITFGTGEKIEGDSTDLTVTSGGAINLTAVTDVVVPANVGVTFGTGEKIEGDSTDLTITSGGAINLTAVTDVVVPTSVGVTFGAGEKIEGDDTDLTLTSGADITLAATADVNVPVNIGLRFGDGGENIETDNTDFTITSGGELNLTAASDVVIPVNIGLHLGDGAEKIESDNTDLTIESGGEIKLKGAGHGIRYLQAVLFDFTTDWSTGNGKMYWHIPPALNGMNLVYCHAECITAGTGTGTDTSDIQIHNLTQAADMLSTVLTIDEDETGSDTAATAAVIDTGEDDVATNDVIRADVDALSPSSDPKGLILTLGFQLP